MTKSFDFEFKDFLFRREILTPKLKLDLILIFENFFLSFEKKDLKKD